MLWLNFYTTYISVDLAHHEIFHAKVGKGGIKGDNCTRYFGSYCISKQRRLRRACAYARSRQSLSCTDQNIDLQSHSVRQHSGLSHVRFKGEVGAV